MIALIRHPPAAIAPGICYGRTDLGIADPFAVVPIVAQLRGLRARVWTSPLARCRRVAEAIGACTVDERLTELDFGAWEGMAWTAVPRAALDEWAADPLAFAPPGGESGAALIARVSAFHADMPAGNHIVVAHGGPLRVLVALARRLPVDLLAEPPAPGSVTFIG